MVSSGTDIIIVEDDMAVSHALERLLAAAGWNSRSFDSAEALLAGEGSGAAVLILDIHLPGMSGLALARHLSAQGHTTPIIFITARDRPETRELARRAGAAAYLVKPFAGSELLQEILRHAPTT